MKTAKIGENTTAITAPRTMEQIADLIGSTCSLDCCWWIGKVTIDTGRGLTARGAGRLHVEPGLGGGAACRRPPSTWCTPTGGTIPRRLHHHRTGRRLPHRSRAPPGQHEVVGRTEVRHRGAGGREVEGRHDQYGNHALEPGVGSLLEHDRTLIAVHHERFAAGPSRNFSVRIPMGPGRSPDWTWPPRLP